MGRSSLATWRDTVADSERSSSAKLVAFALTTWMNAAGSCWPSMAEIARRTSLGKRTVERAVEELEIAGLLEISRSKGRSSNRYTLANHATDAPLTASQLRGRRGRKRVQQRQTGGPTAPKGPSNSVTVAHESAESAESGALHATPAVNGRAASAHFDPDQILADAARFEADEAARREAMEVTE